jgi:endoglycosylceramidase
MNSAAYVGRVGGLAVALGIGAAMTSGAGVAWADKSGSTENHSSAASSTHSGRTGGPKNQHHTKPAKAKANAANSDSSTSPSTDGTPTSAAKTHGSHKNTPHKTRAAAPTDAAAIVAGAAASATHKAATNHHQPVSAAASAVTTKSATAGSVAASAVAADSVAPSTASDAAAIVQTAAASSTTTTAKASLPTNLTGWFRTLVYTPLHALAQLWITSALGVEVDTLINRLAGSYVIGNGKAGTEAQSAGGAGGWLIGDGGAGWSSSTDEVAGGNGGAGGLLGNGGAGGSGGASASGGTGGTAGRLMGIGGSGGNGGTGTDGSIGGDGGKGGAASGLIFGVGGSGGDGGDGSDGGRGGDGGDGTRFLGSGGGGGNAGNSGVGGTATELVALGGAGGNAGLLGTHGAVGKAGTGGPASAVTSSGLLTITSTGMTLTNSDGQVVILHGFNEVYKLDPYDPAGDGFGEDDAEFLSANGFNVVRLGIVWAGVEPEPGAYNTDYINSIQQTVNMLASHGIYTILDMHQDLYSSTLGGEGAPDWATLTGGAANKSYGFPGSYFLNPAESKAWDAFWNNTTASNNLGLEDSYAAAWEQIASAFSGNSAVVGYDIMNEPFAGSSWLPTLLGSTFFGEQQLAPMYNQVAAAIRAVDPTTALIVEPANPATSEIMAILGFPVSLGKIYDSNVILAFHDYCAGSATSGICGWLASQQAKTAYAYGKAHNMAVIMDEFGASDASYDLNAETGAANAFQMSWAEWAYSGSGDITTSGSLKPESLVYDPKVAPTGDNVNAVTLANLAAPYPQTVSGTPKAWSWKSGTFTFSYSTEKVDGSGSFADGSQTVISVPQVEFPNGYQVSVTGGQVVSATNAASLVIVSDGTSGTVSVAVTAKPAAD